MFQCFPSSSCTSLESLCSSENAVGFRGLLSFKDVMHLEQVQRFFTKRIHCLPFNIATSTDYGLLGIRPIQQELDLRKLT